jgi:ketosteroid isomerase-like protein
VRSLRFQGQSGFVLTIAVLVLTICSTARETLRAAASDTDPDENKIKQLVANYAKSVDEADTTLAAQVWLDSPDVSFIHPLGHEHGFDQIKQNVYGHLMGETFSERKLSPHDVSVHVHGDSAWVEFYWDFVAKFRKDGSPITTHGRETQVYWKMPNGWRLVHVHYSGMPVSQERQGF